MTPAREKMTQLAMMQPLRQLCEALAVMEAAGKLNEPERLARATIIDAICAKCPAADAAAEAWAESTDDDPRTMASVILAAVAETGLIR
jgi:hypothetical protein